MPVTTANPVTNGKLVPLQPSVSTGDARVRSEFSLSLLPAMLSEMGLGWVLYRLLHAAQLRTGYVELLNRPRSWTEEQQRNISKEVANKLLHWRESHEFLFSGFDDDFTAAAGRFAGAVTEADAVLAGRWRYFGTSQIEVGLPPQWNRDPLFGTVASTNRHWSRGSKQQHGDIKLIWEASRFSSVFPLGRAYAVTRDEKYAQCFWNLVESWAEQNQPHIGPNWSCGQEAAFRLMAWYFAMHAFAASPHTTPGRLRNLVAMIAVHATRIDRNIDYALSQNNNHGISEAAALWTAGLLSPELPAARRWRDKGRSLLERLAREQFYPDGSYIQHSTMYHRVVLHDYLWAMRLGELNDNRLSDHLYSVVGRAVDFLASMVDVGTGCAPNYGSNDGACVLPLNSCDYRDLRPVLQAGNYLVRRARLYHHGPWDEDLLWLFGPSALQDRAPGAAVTTTDTSRAAVESTINGYQIIRGPNSRAVIRCARYRHRPAQADQLHLDLSWRGINIACDPGTFLYSGTAPWQNALASTRVHNTVTVDDCDQMVRAGRFLWLRWAQGQVNGAAVGRAAAPDYWEGQHNGYRNLNVIHRRAVLRVGDEWIVIDDICGTGRHKATLHWLLADLPYRVCEEADEITLETPGSGIAVKFWCHQAASLNLVRAGLRAYGSPGDSTDQIRGWFSPSYASKEPALSLALECNASLPVRFVTLFRTDQRHLTINNVASITIADSASPLTLALSDPGTTPILRR